MYEEEKAVLRCQSVQVVQVDDFFELPAVQQCQVNKRRFEIGSCDLVFVVYGEISFVHK